MDIPNIREGICHYVTLDSRLAIIGGKDCTSKFHESSTANHVELFDPETKKALR